MVFVDNYHMLMLFELLSRIRIPYYGIESTLQHLVVDRFFEVGNNLFVEPIELNFTGGK